MPTVLVVDDSPVDRMLAGRLLERNPQLAIEYAEDGAEAIARLRSRAPDLVLTDLEMPEKNGFEVVQTVCADFPEIPVILMTSKGSETIAARALQSGAASYVPKASLASDLLRTVERILATSGGERTQSRLMHSLAEAEERFLLENDPDLIDPLVRHIQDLLRCLPLENETERLRVGIAVKEALLNAHYHGNLAIPAGPMDPQHRALADARRLQPPFAMRAIDVRVRITPREASIHIRDDGDGFDAVASLRSSPDTLTAHGRGKGLVLMMAGMDEVRFSPRGNEVTLIKRAAADHTLAIGSLPTTE